MATDDPADTVGLGAFVLEDSGYPAYDLDAARAEMETCVEQHGSEQVSFAFNTTNDPFSIETNTLDHLQVAASAGSATR